MVTPVTSLTTRVKDVVLSTSLMVEKHIMIFFCWEWFLRYIIKLLPKIHFVFFRREAGNCRICYSADAVGDVNLGGKATKVVTKVRCMFYLLNELIWVVIESKWDYLGPNSTVLMLQYSMCTVTSPYFIKFWYLMISSSLSSELGLKLKTQCQTYFLF